MEENDRERVPSLALHACVYCHRHARGLQYNYMRLAMLLCYNTKNCSNTVI